MEITIFPVSWEVLTLEQSNAKLLAAETVQREEFKAVLRNKLESPDARCSRTLRAL